MFTGSKITGRGTLFAPSNMALPVVQTAEGGKPLWVNFWARSRPRGPSFYFSDSLLPEVFCVNHFIWGPKKRSRGFCDFAASTTRVGRFPKPMWKAGALFCSFKHASPSRGGGKIAKTIVFFWTPKSSDLRKRLLVTGYPKNKNWAPGGGIGPTSCPKMVFGIRPFALLVTACLKEQKGYPAL